MSFLLDTNVISEIRRDRDPNVRTWAQHVDDARIYLSVLTIGEIRNGIERLADRDPVQARRFSTWLTEIRERFADRILSIDAGVAERWGRLNAATPVSVVDGLIAATALERGLTIVTRNTRDFDRCGVSLVNPWEA